MTPPSRTRRRAERFQGAGHITEHRGPQATEPRIEREAVAELRFVVVAFDASTLGEERYVRTIDALYFELGASEVDDRGDELRALFERRAPTAERALHAVIAAVRERVVDVPIAYALAGRPIGRRPELVFLTEHGEQEGWPAAPTAW